MQLLPLLDVAAAAAQQHVYEQQPGKARRALLPKDFLHARLGGLALHQDGQAREVCPTAGAVGAAHIDRLITVVGTVTKTGPVKVLEARRLYECGRCKHKCAGGQREGVARWDAQLRCAVPGGPRATWIPSTAPLWRPRPPGLWWWPTWSLEALWTCRPCAPPNATSPARVPRSGAGRGMAGGAWCGCSGP